MNTQAIANGTVVLFKGYTQVEEGVTPTLTANTNVTVIEFDAAQDLYNVKDEAGNTDSVFAEELEVPKSGTGTARKAAKKAATKQAANGPKAQAATPAATPAAAAAPATRPAAKKAATKNAANAPKAEPVVETAAEPEPNRFAEIGKLADGGDKAATKYLSTICKGENVDENGFGELWEDVGKHLDTIMEPGSYEAFVATAKKAARPAPEPKPEVVVLPFKKTASVGKAIDDAGGDALVAAKTLAERKEQTTYALGGVLSFIKRNDTFLSFESTDKDEAGNAIPYYEAGLKGFNAYVKDELGLEPRTADYYVRIYEKFSHITTEKALSKHGWTKLRELLPLDLSKDNVDEWLEKTANLTTDELKEQVKTTLVANGTPTHGSRNTATMTTFKLVAHEDQANMWKEAFGQARQSIGEDKSDSECANHIFNEWLGFYSVEQATDGTTAE